MVAFVKTLIKLFNTLERWKTSSRVYSIQKMVKICNAVEVYHTISGTYYQIYTLLEAFANENVGSYSIKCLFLKKKLVSVLSS